MFISFQAFHVELQKLSDVERETFPDANTQLNDLCQQYLFIWVSYERHEFHSTRQIDYFIKYSIVFSGFYCHTLRSKNTTPNIIFLCMNCVQADVIYFKKRSN